MSMSIDAWALNYELSHSPAAATIPPVAGDVPGSVSVPPDGDPPGAVPAPGPGTRARTWPWRQRCHDERHVPSIALWGDIWTLGRFPLDAHGAPACRACGATFDDCDPALGDQVTLGDAVDWALGHKCAGGAA